MRQLTNLKLLYQIIDIMFEKISVDASYFPELAGFGFSNAMEIRNLDLRKLVANFECWAKVNSGLWSWSFRGYDNYIGFSRLKKLCGKRGISFFLVGERAQNCLVEYCSVEEPFIVAGLLNDLKEDVKDVQIVGWKFDGAAVSSRYKRSKFRDGEIWCERGVVEVIASSYDWDSVQLFCK